MGRQISVSETADRLGVTPHRVRQRIEDGSLLAERVGNRWSIDEADLLPLLDGPKVGRPLSERSAGALLDYADSSPQAQAALNLLAPSERRRTRERWRSITDHARDSDDVADVADVAEGYVTRADLKQLIRDYLLDGRIPVRVRLGGKFTSRRDREGLHWPARG